MTKPIDNTNTAQYQQISSRKAETGPMADPTSQDGPPAGKIKNANLSTDTIQLTQGAMLMQAVEEQLAKVGEVDGARVDAIRGMIESGNYEVSAERVASKLMLMDNYLPHEK